MLPKSMLLRDVGQAPNGPLLGNELARAIELLTDRQFCAYRYRREGHAWNWIAQRMGTSRTAVIHLVAKAEKRLGYEPTVTAKQKTAYKSVAKRRAESESAWDAYADQLTAQLSPEERRRLKRILETSTSDEEARRRLDKRLKQLVRERHALERGYLSPGADHDDDWSRGVGEAEAEMAAGIEADFGSNSVTGAGMRPEDFVVDEGGGYDRL